MSFITKIQVTCTLLPLGASLTTTWRDLGEEGEGIGVPGKASALHRKCSSKLVRGRFEERGEEGWPRGHSRGAQEGTDTPQARMHISALSWELSQINK